MAVDQVWAANLVDITDIAEMPEEPNKNERLADWMVWMCHRAWLNDSTLKNFDFSNMQMPLPHDEPKIAPKLMNALATNTNITTLLLANSNFQAPQAMAMGESLRSNTA